MNIPSGYIEVREALYGKNGLFPDVGMADVRSVFGKTIWRKSRWARFRREFVRQADVDRVRRQIRKANREMAELIG